MGGGGGEYVPQKGFGWSNGVALYLLQYTGSGGTNAVDEKDDDELSLTVQILVLVVMCATLSVLLAMGCIMYRNFRNGSKESSSDQLDRDNENIININILQRDNMKNSLI